MHTHETMVAESGDGEEQIDTKVCGVHLIHNNLKPTYLCPFGHYYVCGNNV